MLCTDDDLKEIGIPKGPRVKLRNGTHPHPRDPLGPFELLDLLACADELRASCRTGVQAWKANGGSFAAAAAAAESAGGSILGPGGSIIGAQAGSPGSPTAPRDKGYQGSVRPRSPSL